MVEKAIIIFSDDNGFLLVFGIPIIKRLLIILRQTGIKKIIVVGKPEYYDKISACIDEHFVFYPANRIENIDQLFDKKERILILKANHVIDKYSLKRFLEECKTSPCVLTSDKNTPIFIVSCDNIKAIVEILWKNGKQNDLFSFIKKIKLNNKLPFLVNSTEDIKKAEQYLIDSLSSQKIETDSLIAKYFDRNISLFFTKRLVNTKITPNQITLAGMSIGLLGAFLLSFPYYWSQLLGSFLFLFCIIVDGMDGEMARLKLKESRFGHYLDIITDNIVHIAIFTGMGYGLYRRTNNDIYLYLILVLLIGFGLCAISVYQCILKKSKKELEKSPFLIKFMSFLTNRDFAYLIVLLAIIDKLNWFFIMTAIGSYIFSAVLWIASYKNYPSDSVA